VPIAVTRHDERPDAWPAGGPLPPLRSCSTGRSPPRRRPMRRVGHRALMGFDRGGPHAPPLRRQTGPPGQLRGKTAWACYRHADRLATVKSRACAALTRQNTTVIDRPHRDHKRADVQAFVPTRHRRDSRSYVTSHPGRQPMPSRVVPGDISSAASGWAAAITPGAEIRWINVGFNPTRTAILDVA